LILTGLWRGIRESVPNFNYPSFDQKGKNKNTQEWNAAVAEPVELLFRVLRTLQFDERPSR